MASTVDASRVAEHHEDRDTLLRNVSTLRDMLRSSRRTVFYTGAGVSTSAGVGDYRGPSGAWTQRRIEELRRSEDPGERKELALLLAEQAKEAKKAAKPVCSLDAVPAFCHRAIAQLIQNGTAHSCITTNLDGLFRKAGIPPHQLCCLHGDIYIERCTSCHYEFERNYETRDAHSRHVHDHHIGTCEKCGSSPPASYTGRAQRGVATGADGDGCAQNGLIGTTCKNVGTKDTHINFGECLDNADWNAADKLCRNADLCIIMGTSMSLRHITHFPFLAKKTIMINLQATPDDSKVDLRIWSPCDTVMSELFSSMGLTLSPPSVWIPRDYVPVEDLPRRGIPPYYVAAAKRLDALIKQSKEGGRKEKKVIRIGTSVVREAGGFRWRILTEGSGVVAVRYGLHPTFTPAVVTVKTAPFAIERVGWGEFTIEVAVMMRDGATHSFSHDLKLDKATDAKWAIE